MGNEQLGVTGRTVGKHAGFGMEQPKKQAGETGDRFPQEQLIDEGKDPVRIALTVSKGDEARFHHRRDPGRVDTVAADITDKKSDRSVL